MWLPSPYPIVSLIFFIFALLLLEVGYHQGKFTLQNGTTLRNCTRASSSHSVISWFVFHQFSPEFSSSFSSLCASVPISFILFYVSTYRTRFPTAPTRLPVRLWHQQLGYIMRLQVEGRKVDEKEKGGEVSSWLLRSDHQTVDFLWNGCFHNSDTKIIYNSGTHRRYATYYFKWMHCVITQTNLVKFIWTFRDFNPQLGEQSPIQNYFSKKKIRCNLYPVWDW